MKYDYLIVGAGFFGSICAYELKRRGFSVCVVEKRSHIGGNCYTSNIDGINIHEYGPHIFHTSNDIVWKWINQFVQFNNFTLRPIANFEGELYSLPFNMWTFNKLWGVHSPEEAKKIIYNQSKHIQTPNNLEEQAIKLVGEEIYLKLIKGYTKKQWKKDPVYLPASIIRRLPVRFTFDNNYFNDIYQGIPIGGYTAIFEKLLNGIEVILEHDFFLDVNPKYNNLIYTGPVDKYFGFKYGPLEYKTTRFEHKKVPVSNFQGNAMMNFTSEKVDFTRIIEHQHFEYLKERKDTWITYEYPDDYRHDEKEPYYPVNDELNNSIYKSYQELAKQEKNVHFGGRLAEYKYYDMDKVIESALKFISDTFDN